MKKLIKATVLLAVISTLAACGEKPSVVISACNIEAISNAGNPGEAKVVLSRGAKTDVTGWIADVATSKTPEKVSLTLVGEDGHVYGLGESEVNVIRTDVSKVFAKSIDKSGFSLKGDVSGVPLGLYTIQLAGTFEDRVGVCASAKQIEVQ